MQADSTYNLIADGSIARIHGSTAAAVDGIERTLAALIADPGLHLRFSLLVDIRTLSMSLTSDEARSIAEVHVRLTRGRTLRTALLASAGSGYGIGRMIQTWAACSGLEMKVFTEEAGALTWLCEDETAPWPATGGAR